MSCLLRSRDRWQRAATALISMRDTNLTKFDVGAAAAGGCMLAQPGCGPCTPGAAATATLEGIHQLTGGSTLPPAPYEGAFRRPRARGSEVSSAETLPAAPAKPWSGPTLCQLNCHFGAVHRAGKHWIDLPALWFVCRPPTSHPGHDFNRCSPLLSSPLRLSPKHRRHSPVSSLATLAIASPSILIHSEAVARQAVIALLPPPAEQTTTSVIYTFTRLLSPALRRPPPRRIPPAQ